MRLRPLDIAILLAAAAAVALASVRAYSGASGTVSAVVGGRSGEWVYPLDEDRDIEVDGPLGLTYVEIRGGKVRVSDSPCLGKTCVASGEISKASQWLACLPNQVFVRIEGAADEEGVDAGAY
jgi:hypothetical protein